LDNASLSKKPLKTAGEAIAAEDIPQAVREPGKKSLVVASEPRPKPVWAIGGFVTLVAISTTGGIWYGWQAQQNSVSATSNPASVTESSAVSTETAAPETEAINADESEIAENVLGHLPYDQASASELSAITWDGSIKMRQGAAQAFIQMQEAAHLDGISLIPISGFRTLEDQDYLFFSMKAQRGQASAERAEVSAPPGYSEHHTGYAVDIGDENVPATDLSINFENTPAFKWLAQNAAYYSFELSFPKNNPQGISYEPWHWRFVGDRHSLETFYKAQNLK
jgi:D-alanyl-D-alanine carboxypeptidase